jgi:type IV pilus assembly protein PilE
MSPISHIATSIEAMKNMHAGFTLVEVMITAVIIAILASIAFPAYTDYVIRGKLVEATSGLADFRTRLEQYYQDNRNYGAAGASTCGTDGDATFEAGEVAVPTSRYFTFTCTVPAGSNQQYTATASNSANQGLGGAGSYAFTVNHNNVRQTTAFPGATGLAKNCWIAKKAETC